MTMGRSSANAVGATRGRGLDALFDGATAPVNPISAGKDIEADLAALLDDEVVAAETGGRPPAASLSPVTPTREVEPPAVTAEPIDVPPLAVEARPAPAQPLTPVPVPGTGSTRAPAVPPATRRFGAIIMESEPAPTTTPDSDALIVPRDTAGKPVGPGVGDTEDPITPLPTQPDRTNDQKAIVISRLDQVLPNGWQKALHQQIDTLYKQVATEFSSPPAKAERALTMLREARTLLIESPEEYVNAEYRMMQVRAMLDRVKESRSQSVHYGPRILGYQAAWLLLLLLGLVFAAPLTHWITRVGNVTGQTLLNLYPVINTMLWGGIGGVVGALYTLWWHISQEQDFDRQYMMWYLVQPLMGVVLGGITFLVLAGGFLILNVNLSDAQASEGARLLPYLAAVLAGFRQNFIYEQLERLISLFTPATRKESNGEGPSV